MVSPDHRHERMTVGRGRQMAGGMNMDTGMSTNMDMDTDTDTEMRAAHP